MKIEEVRSSFTIYLIAGDLSRLDGLAEAIRLSGYMVATFTELTAAFSEFPSNPPHFLIFDSEETKFNLHKAIKQVSIQLPESHIFVVAPVEQREQVIPMLESGVYDLIYTPLASQTELLRALDRAAERDYYMYLSESASAAPVAETYAAETELPAISEAGSMDFAQAMPSTFVTPFGRNLFESKTFDDRLQVFMQSASRLLDGAPVLFMKWIVNRRVLVATLGEGLGDFELGSLGINFNEPGSRFKSASLRDPLRVPELNDMVTEVFATHEFFALPLEVLGELQGVLIFLCARPSGDQESALAEGLFLAGQSLGLLEAEKRLHVTSVKDIYTDVLNRPNFLLRIQQEISRARRTNLPVGLLAISIDQYPDVAAALGQEEAQVVLRMTARIFEKCSRVNDLVGRIGPAELGMLLPHTGKKGSMIKAERLRRLMRKADFSKVLSAFPQVTLSIGVSEYPTMVRDAEELLHSAEEALYQIRKLGNRTAVAPMPENFTPDFAVVERDIQ